MTAISTTRSHQRTVSLALQGGGALGAFSWGVLDALLEDGRIVFDSVSGTSAGAMNALMLVDGYEKDGADGARESLANFWQTLITSNAAISLGEDMLDQFYKIWRLPFTTPYDAMRLSTATLSPYEFNPLNCNPLESVIDELVDFERVQNAQSIRLSVSATHVERGKIAVFSGQDVTSRSVLASACLPNLFQAVEINDEAYWDGGYCGNPALWPFYTGQGSDDILLLQLEPVHDATIPENKAEIFSRIRDLIFNGSLTHELHAICLLNQVLDADEADRSVEHPRKRLHRIDMDHALTKNQPDSLDIGFESIMSLFEAGRRAGKNWLRHHLSDLGVRDGFDLNAEFPSLRLRGPAGRRARSTRKGKAAAHSSKSVSLAIQGGGGRGVYIGGVLHQLMAEKKLEVKAISAASGGALNAVLFAQGLLEKSPNRGQEVLTDFWKKVFENNAMLAFEHVFFKVFSSAPDLQSGLGEMEQADSRSSSDDSVNVGRMSNPLREILLSYVDFDRLQRDSPVPLFIAATDVKSGIPRVFTGDEITIDVVMATTCLPYLFTPVKIGSDTYWDGGYSANPPLWPFLSPNVDEDVLLLQLYPEAKPGIPKEPESIFQRMTEINFNNSLIQALRTLDFLDKQTKGRGGKSDFSRARMHRIVYSQIDHALPTGEDDGSGPSFCQAMFEAGTDAATIWIADHLHLVGKQDTFDFSSEIGRETKETSARG